MALLAVGCHRPVRDDNSPGGWSVRTDRFQVVCWGRLAERVEKQITTGAYITVTGRVQTYDYNRKIEVEGGSELIVTVMGFEIVADDLNLIVKGHASAPVIKEPEEATCAV